MRVSSLLRAGGIVTIATLIISAPLAQGAGTANTAADWTTLSGSKANPIRWGKCTPKRYLINRNGVSMDEANRLKGAIKDVIDRTNINFKYGGTTGVMPKSGLDNVPSNTIVLSFAWPSESSYLRSAGSPGGGVGGNLYQENIIKGAVTINKASKRFPASTRRLIYLHESAHAFGLGHAQGSQQIMYPVAYQQKGWGAGDLSGLRAVGYPSTSC